MKEREKIEMKRVEMEENGVMTIIDFLCLPKKERKEYCIRHGITSHHSFARFEMVEDSLEEFCKVMELEKGYVTHMYCGNRGSYRTINFTFHFPFQTHVDESVARGGGNEINICVEGASRKTLSISSPSISNDTYIWVERNNFFDDREMYNDFFFSISPMNKNDIRDAIKDLEERTKDYIPHIEYCLSTLRDGTFEEAYNAIHIESKFKVGDTPMESSYLPLYIRIRHDALEIFGVNLDILECMLLSKYMEDNAITEVAMMSHVNLNDVIKSCRKEHLMRGRGKENKEKLDGAMREFKELIEGVVRDLSEKYGIHESYFMGTDWCNVRIPKRLNDVDLSKPFTA